MPPILGGSNTLKSMVILRDFPYNNALFGLVSYNDPCCGADFGDQNL